MNRNILLDEEGENRALRMFLAVYSGRSGCTITEMQLALKRSGFDGCWPEWANNSEVSHLSKSGAQSWIRHLINLETDPVLYLITNFGLGSITSAKEKYGSL